MPANFCLLPEISLKFKQALKDGTINPEKMAEMSSVERHDFLAGIVGKNHAKAVNSLFEAKILLKNQKQGYLTWAKQVSGISPATRRDIVTKIERMQNVLDPADSKQFMQDLTATRLGVNVTETEARTIADLSRKVSDMEALRKPDKTFPTKENRLNYGRAVEDLTDYVAELKKDADKIKLRDIKRLPVSGGLLGKFVSKTAGNLKSLSASLDNSAIFRQGWKIMLTDPEVWAKNAAQTFATAAKTVGGKNVLREVNADIISRPNYDRMVRAKLAIKNPEEAFPESLAEKVPALGRLYKASEAAFTGFQYKNRADVFDKYLEIAKKGGVDIDDKQQLEAIGKLVNSLTGRGNLGKAEAMATDFNNIFFSPRFLKSNFDTLTAHQLQKDVTPFVRKKAATNLLRIVGGTAGVLFAANQLMPGSVEVDPRSSDFGKIKVGDTRFDVTGGMGSILTLAARLLPSYSDKFDSRYFGIPGTEGWSPKSKSTGGSFTDLVSGSFGSKSWDQVALDFFMNKLSPAAGSVVRSFEGKDYSGNDTNLINEAAKASLPISFHTFNDLKENPNAAPLLLSMILDGLGVGANTYSLEKKDSWRDATSEELVQFKRQVGETKFKEANKKFDDMYNSFESKISRDADFIKLSDDEKKSALNSEEESYKKKVLKSYGFEYKAAKRDRKKINSILDRY